MRGLIRRFPSIKSIKNQGLFPNFTLKNNSTSTEWLRAAPPGFSFMACAICLKFVDCFAIMRAYLFCHLPILPLALLLPPSPDPLPCGKGETISLFCRGLRPLHPGVWTGRGTGSASIGDTRRGARVLVAGSPCHRYTRRGGANKAGTLKIHRAADRRQAAGKSSRAEYSEVPGIVGPLSGSDGSFFVILPDRRSSFCGEKRPPGRPGQAPQSHRRWCCRIRTCYPFRR